MEALAMRELDYRVIAAYRSLSNYNNGMDMIAIGQNIYLRYIDSRRLQCSAAV